MPYGGHVVFFDKVVSRQPIRMDAPLGVERPYNCTSVGKVFLASLPQERIGELAASGAFERKTKNSLLAISQEMSYRPPARSITA